MVWIREAEALGRAQAEKKATAAEAAKAERDAAKAEFDAEPVSEKRVAAYLRKQQEPVIPIVRTLRKAGYKVKREGPGYVYHSYKGEPGSKEDLSRFTLTRTVESPGWGMTDYSKWERQVFAIEWTVSRERPDGHNPLLGTISIYPTIGGQTHYAGVQYRVVDAKEWPPKPSTLDIPVASTTPVTMTTGFIESVVQGWIAKAQAPVVVNR